MITTINNIKAIIPNAIDIPATAFYFDEPANKLLSL